MCLTLLTPVFAKLKRESFNVVSAHLLIDFPYSGSTRLLLRLHAPSWNDPLIRMPAAAHKQHLLTHHTHKQPNTEEKLCQQVAKLTMITSLSSYLSYITDGTRTTLAAKPHIHSSCGQNLSLGVK